jgi:hypothetical protein
MVRTLPKLTTKEGEGLGFLLSNDMQNILIMGLWYTLIQDVIELVGPHPSVSYQSLLVYPFLSEAIILSNLCYTFVNQNRPFRFLVKRGQ